MSGKGSRIFWSLVFCLMMVPFVESRAVNRRDIGQLDGPISSNIIRKDFFVLEIPEEAIQDEYEEQMSMMTERRWKQQIALDRFVLKLYEEFQRREREGILDSYRTRI